MNLSRFFWYIRHRGPKYTLNLTLAELRVYLLRLTHHSFSQLREDLLIDQALNFPKSGFYIDIGANNPTRFNNTKRFFDRGWSGINVDPNPASLAKFQNSRPEDINLQAAIGQKTGQAKLFIFDPDTLSTLSASEKAFNQRLGGRLVGETVVPVYTLASLIKKHHPSGQIDLLSVDAEGVDFIVLKSNDWKKYRPSVVCVECLNNGVLTSEGTQILKYMQQQGYREFSRTFSNLLLVKNDYSPFSKVVINTHRSAPTHSEEIKKYFLKHKTPHLWFVAHEFAQLPSRRSYIEYYRSGQLVSVQYSPDFSWIPEPLTYFKDFLFSLYYIIRKIDSADLYLGISAYDTLPGLLLKPFLHIKKIVFLTIDFVPHRFTSSVLNRLYIAIDKYCVRSSDQVWNPSPRMQEGREKLWGYPKSFRKNQIDFPFGIWLDNPPKHAKKSTTPLLLFSGHLLPKQGVQLAINSLPAIAKAVPGVRLSIVGAGEYEEQLRQLSQDVGVSHLIIFHGRASNAQYYSLLRQSWLGLSTFDPKLDTFSYYSDPAKVKMYLGFGLPVVLTDVPHIAKIVDQRQAGKIVSYTNRSFISAVVKLLKDKKLLSQYSQNARDLAKEYDWESLLTSHLSNICLPPTKNSR